MLKTILISTLPLLLAIVLLAVVGVYGIVRVQNLRSQIAEAQKDKMVLTDKLNILQNVDASVETGSQTSSAALPAKNSAFLVLGQLRSTAQQNGILLSNLSSGLEIKDSSGLSRVDITLSMAGPIAGIIAFLDGVGKIAPITLIDKIGFDGTKGVPFATITLKTFWVPFPQNLPALSEQISGLTEDENGILTSVNALIQPQFVEIPASDTGGKSDPFAQ